jgi:hypothetical protein
MTKPEFTGDINDLKEAAVILYNLRTREQEVKVNKYLGKSDDKLNYYREKADAWIAKHIKPKI